MARIRQVDVDPRHAIPASRERDVAEKRELRHKCRYTLDQRGSPDVKLGDDMVAVDDLDAQLLESSDDATILVMQLGAKQVLDVCFGKLHRLLPGMRPTMTRRNQSSSALIGVDSASISMVSVSPLRVIRVHGIRVATPRPSPSLRSCRAYHRASRRLNRDRSVMGLTSM